MDIVGLIFEFEGMKYIFIVIDRFIRWFEVILMYEMKIEDCVKVFVRYWISRFGVLGDVTLDRGR